MREPEINFRSQNIVPEDVSDMESRKQSKERELEAGEWLQDTVWIEGIMLMSV